MRIQHFGTRSVFGASLACLSFLAFEVVHKVYSLYGAFAQGRFWAWTDEPSGGWVASEARLTREFTKGFIGGMGMEANESMNVYGWELEMDLTNLSWAKRRRTIFLNPTGSDTDPSLSLTAPRCCMHFSPLTASRTMNSAYG